MRLLGGPCLYRPGGFRKMKPEGLNKLGFIGFRVLGPFGVPIAEGLAFKA